MIYLSDVSVEEWADRYNIRLDKITCNVCGSMLSFEKVFLMKNYRGIEAGPCGNCGDDTKPFRVKPIGDAAVTWKELVDGN